MNISDSSTDTQSAAKRPSGPHRAQSSSIVDRTGSTAIAPTRAQSLRRTQSSLSVPGVDRPAVHREPSDLRSITSDTKTDDDCTSVFSNVRDTLTADATTPDESPTSEAPNPLTKFLLVDDNHINLKVLSTYMKKLSIEYDLAMNGQEAVDLFCLPRRTYGCVLMDISMPVMDGFEATRCIRAYESLQGLGHVPIIGISGLASDDAHREAIGSGMDLLLTKPVKLRALGSLLETMGI